MDPMTLLMALQAGKSLMQGPPPPDAPDTQPLPTSQAGPVNANPLNQTRRVSAPSQEQLMQTAQQPLPTPEAPAVQGPNPATVNRMAEIGKQAQKKQVTDQGEVEAEEGKFSFKEMVMSPEVISSLASVAMQPRRQAPAPSLAPMNTNSTFQQTGANPYMRGR